MNTDIQPQNVLTFILVMIGLVLSVILYWLPAIAASRRGHVNAGAIAVLNLFLGWTFVGWVIALVWAYTEHKEGK